jgi:hypothetical protein
MADKVEEGSLVTPSRPSRSRGDGRQQSSARTTRGAAGTTSASAMTTGRSTRSTAQRSNGGRDLRRDLRDFASARPQGWNHDDWLNFLESLKERGHDINDRDAIGMMLEKERLDLALSRIRGMGPQRRQALVERYGTIWNLRNADVDEIAATAKIPRNLAEAVKADLAN